MNLLCLPLASAGQLSVQKIAFIPVVLVPSIRSVKLTVQKVGIQYSTFEIPLFFDLFIPDQNAQILRWGGELAIHDGGFAALCFAAPAELCSFWGI